MCLYIKLSAHGFAIGVAGMMTSVMIIFCKIQRCKECAAGHGAISAYIVDWDFICVNQQVYNYTDVFI